MIIFYNKYKDIQNWPLPLANLLWTHNSFNSSNRFRFVSNTKRKLKR